MGLPNGQLATGKVEVNGQAVEVRALSRRAALKLWALKDDPDAVEQYMIEQATGASSAEVTAFRESTPADAITPLVDAILALSGLQNAEGETGPKA